MLATEDAGEGKRPRRAVAARPSSGLDSSSLRSRRPFEESAAIENMEWRTSTGSRISSGGEKNRRRHPHQTGYDSCVTGDDLTVKPLARRPLFPIRSVLVETCPTRVRYIYRTLGHMTHKRQDPGPEPSTVGGQPPCSDDLIDHQPGRRKTSRGRRAILTPGIHCA